VPPNPLPHPTESLSLRVSVATLVRVVFDHPHTDETLLALERKASVTVAAGEPQVRVWAQPFGGGIQFRNLAPLQNLIGNFEFDSERSRSENDFRILIRPADWPALRQFCLEQFQTTQPVLDSDPARELEEEFADALNIQLKPDQYTQQPVAIVAENTPTPTGSHRALGINTVRLYRIFEARIVDPDLVLALLTNSEAQSDADLHAQALADFQRGGRGRANAVLAMPLKQVTDAYLALPPEARLQPLNFNNHLLDVTVTAVLANVSVPIYEVL
jgi:hypothetical protein